MALNWLDASKVQTIVDQYWNNAIFQYDPYYQATGNPYSLTDTPNSQPAFGQATFTLGWNSQGKANGTEGVIAVLADNRNGELGNPATLTLQAEYDISQGYSSSFSTSEAVTESFQVGVNAKFGPVGSETSFGISGTTTYGSGTTDSHVTTTAQDESFPFTIPQGKAYEAQLWHSVETVEVPFTISLHVTGTTTGTPTIGVPIDEEGYTLTTPIGPVFGWVHGQGSGGPVGDDYVNYSQDPTNPSNGIYTLHGTLTAYSGGAFYVQVVDATDGQASDPAPPPSITGDVSVQQFSPTPADGLGAGASRQGGEADPALSSGLTILDGNALDGLEKSFWQNHFGLPYSFQFSNSHDLTDSTDPQPNFGMPEYIPTTIYPPFYAIINNIDGLQDNDDVLPDQNGLGLSTELTYSQQDGYDTTHTTSSSVSKTFEQKVSVDFGTFGGANADFKLDGTLSWSSSTTDSQSTTATQTVGPFTVVSAPGQAKQLQVTHVQEAIVVPYETVVHVSGTIQAHTIDLGTGADGPTETLTVGDLFKFVHNQGPNGVAGAEYVLYSQDPDNSADGLLTLSGQVTVYSDANADVYDVSAVDVTQAIEQNPANYPPATPVTSPAPDL